MRIIFSNKSCYGSERNTIYERYPLSPEASYHENLNVIDESITTAEIFGMTVRGKKYKRKRPLIFTMPDYIKDW